MTCVQEAYLQLVTSLHLQHEKAVIFGAKPTCQFTQALFPHGESTRIEEIMYLDVFTERTSNRTNFRGRKASNLWIVHQLEGGLPCQFDVLRPAAKDVGQSLRRRPFIYSPASATD
jgi:hypothetical protein